MKTTIISLVCLVSLLVCNLQPAWASPRGGSNNAIDYLSGDSDKDNWSGGVFYRGRKHAVEISGTPQEMDEYRGIVYAGYNVQPWLVVYALVGYNRADFDYGVRAEDDGNLIYGAATEVNLFSHEIQDPLLMVDSIRINAGAAYYMSKTEVFSEDQHFGEAVAQATVSIVNDVKGSKRYQPESIALFFGPMYADIQGNDIKDDRDNQLGLVAGLEFFHSKRVSYFGAVEVFEYTGFSAGLNVHF